jgi:hypothetical protein
MTLAFITQYPEVTLAIIVALLGLVFWFIRFIVKNTKDTFKDFTDSTKESFANLTDAINSLHVTIDTIRKDMHSDIGSLKDRMQAQETTCKMQRNHCPLDRTGSIQVHQ